MMKSLSVAKMLLVALALVGGLPIAQAGVCLDEVAVNEVGRLFRLDPRPVSFCDDEQREHRVFEALLFIKNLPPLALVKDAYDNGAIQGTPWDYLRSRVKKIAIDEAVGECTATEVTAHSLSGDSSIHICPAAARLNVLQISAYLMHEARHMRKGADHANCEQGEFKEENGYSCDRSFADAGSYGVEAAYLMRVARTPSLPPSICDDARALAVETLSQHFNRPAFEQRYVWLLETADRQIVAWNGQSVTSLYKLKADEVASLHGSVPEIFNKQTGSVQILLGSQRLVTTSSAYSLSLSKNFKRPDWLKFIGSSHSDTLHCLLFTTMLHCDEGSRTSSLVFRGITPLALLSGPQGVEVLDTKGQLFRIDRGDERTELLTNLNLQRHETNYKVLLTSIGMKKGGFVHPSVAKTDIGIGVDLEGHLRSYSGLFQDGTPITTFAGQKFNQVLGYVRWSEKASAF